MLDAQSLAARMAELEGHVDDVLASSKRAQDDRTRLMAVGEGRRNVESLLRLAVLAHAEQQQAAGQDAWLDGPGHPGEPLTPVEIGEVLRELIRGGAAVPTRDDDAYGVYEADAQGGEDTGNEPHSATL